jgi:hypothetical protein
MNLNEKSYFRIKRKLIFNGIQIISEFKVRTKMFQENL